MIPFLSGEKEKIDIGKMFEKYIDIEMIERKYETKMEFHTVVLRKKANIQLVEDPLKYILEEELFNWMLKNKLNEFYTTKWFSFKIKK